MGRCLDNRASGHIMPVRFFCAGIAQLVERNLAKVEVGSSSLLSRSRLPKGKTRHRGFPFLVFAVDSGLLDLCRLDLVCRGTGTARGFLIRSRLPAVPTLAGWQSGHAAACKAVYAGSIPTPASIFTSR